MTVPDQLEKEIDERITHYPVSKRSAVLPVLHALQHEFGHLSEEAIEWTAKKLDLEPISVLEVEEAIEGTAKKLDLEPISVLEVGKLTFGELIHDVCGGMKPGRELKAVIPGGSSAKVLRADETFTIKRDGQDVEIDIWGIPMDFDTLMACGSMAGSGGVIVMDDSRSMAWVLNNLNNFYAHESCGQCTPCREGSLWMKKISDRIVSGDAAPDDVATLESVAYNIDGKTICAFGEASSWPTESFIDKFRDELLAATREENAKKLHNPVTALAAAGLE